MTQAIPSATVFDAIVVGSGITGGIAAKELCEQGLSTLMIERGRHVEHRKDYPTEGMPPWEFLHRGRTTQNDSREQSIQKQCYAYSQATKHFFINDKKSPYQTPKKRPFLWTRGDQLGGKSLLWHRQSYRMSAMDFTANALDGHGVDWPIRYDDLVPWYEHIEKFVGISGANDNLEVLPDSIFLPPFEMNAVESHIQAVFEKKFPDRPMVIGRTAHLSQPQEHHRALGRYKCMARDECQKGCSFGAYFSTQSASLPAARRTNKLTLATDSIVHSVIYDVNTGRASGVKVIDRHTLEERVFNARIIFLCASTIATTQIMLNSKSEFFPNGIANSSGVLGHYLMDHVQNTHVHGEISGFDNEYYVGRRPTTTFIPRFTNVNKKDSKYHRGFSYMAFAYREGATRQSAEGFGAQFKHKQSMPGPWKFSMYGMGEMLPRFENSVRLHPNKTDAWGIPQVVINCSFGENEKSMMQDIADRGVEMLEAISAKNIVRNIGDNPPGTAIHEVGTARMGRDKRSSVLNANNQCHDVPNLFVTDGAAWASSSWQNPSLTFMAITARAAHFAAKQFKQSNI